MVIALIAAWMLQAFLGTAAVAIYLRQLRRPQPWPDAWPAALVIVPVRWAPGLDRFLEALAAQDHPRWRVVFAVEAEADPAYAPLTRFVAAHAGARLVVAGVATRRGQKVHNLLAALGEDRHETMVVLLDADTEPPPGLLRALLRPIVTGQAPIASGYRWSLPADAHRASAAVSWLDLAVATLPPLRRFAPCWGGALAIHETALLALDLPRLWDRAVSDDLTLGREAARLGLRVYGPLTARAPTFVAFGWRGAFGFGVRQYRLLRLHAPRLWLFAAATASLAVAGPITAVALYAAGSDWPLAPFAVAFGLRELRARLRAHIARAILPPPAAARTAAAEGHRFPAAGSLLRFAAILTSTTGRRIVWADRSYTLDSRGLVIGMSGGATQKEPR